MRHHVVPVRLYYMLPAAIGFICSTGEPAGCGFISKTNKVISLRQSVGECDLPSPGAAGIVRRNADRSPYHNLHRGMHLLHALNPHAQRNGRIRMAMTGIICTAALLLDHWLGEPRRYHPLVGFGRAAAWVEARFNGRRRWQGAAALLLLLAPPLVCGALLARLPRTGAVTDLLLLYLAVGAASLAQHARAVAVPLAAGDIAQARSRVAWMVSRDTSRLDRPGIARAAVESVLENGNDAVFGALFWFVLLGAPGAVLYRLANTLDAMWGYRTERFVAFGWAAARLDDLLNFAPARLAALTYALLGDGRRAFGCWRRQGCLTDSPNAGVVMAAGAGALRLQLGGPAVYHGALERRPQLGEGAVPQAADIGRAVRLVQYGIVVWLAVILLGGPLHG